MGTGMLDMLGRLAMPGRSPPEPGSVDVVAIHSPFGQTT